MVERFANWNARDDLMGIEIEDFLDFCEKIEVKDNDLLVFKCTKKLFGSQSEQFIEVMSNAIKKKISKKVVLVILGPDIDNIMQVPEKEMNKCGWFRRD